MISCFKIVLERRFHVWRFNGYQLNVKFKWNRQKDTGAAEASKAETRSVRKDLEEKPG